MDYMSKNEARSEGEYLKEKRVARIERAQELCDGTVEDASDSTDMLARHMLRKAFGDLICPPSSYRATLSTFPSPSPTSPLCVAGRTNVSHGCAALPQMSPRQRGEGGASKRGLSLRVVRCRGVVSIRKGIS